VSGIKFVFAVVTAALAAAAAPAGTSTPAASTRACFGAAVRDSQQRCNNPKLRYEVIPSPAKARRSPNAPCTIIEERGAFRVCEFGAAASSARATVALLGDSHAAHWRAALEVVAAAENWRGLSITLSGCPYSTATRVLAEPLRSDCIARNDAVPQWLARHPEIHTIFVSELSGAQWEIPAGTDQFRSQVDAYTRAWGRLPASVRHVVVIQDTPKARPTTRACIERAHAAGRDAGRACAVPRDEAIDPDAAAFAADRLGAPRFQTVDLNRYFCDRRWCYPVIGGALVQKDLHHLTAVFVRTLGPYLLDAVRRLDLS
jgi:SGNH domain (fused to AT3 domains)